MTTHREDFPEIWGPSEIVAFAGKHLKETGKGLSVAYGTVQGWMADETFPRPVVTLRMGPIYLAEEARPWVVERLSRSKTRPGASGNRVPDETRAAIAGEKGKGVTQQQVADRYGVSLPTVRRIWSESGG